MTTFLGHTFPPASIQRGQRIVSLLSSPIATSKSYSFFAVLPPSARLSLHHSGCLPTACTARSYILNSASILAVDRCPWYLGVLHIARASFSLVPEPPSIWPPPSRLRFWFMLFWPRSVVCSFPLVLPVGNTPRTALEGHQCPLPGHHCLHICTIRSFFFCRPGPSDISKLVSKPNPAIPAWFPLASVSLSQSHAHSHCCFAHCSCCFQWPLSPSLRILC